MAFITFSLVYIFYNYAGNDLEKHLIAPNPLQIQNNLDDKYSQAGHEEAVFDIFHKTGGFFIEIGAFDGVHHSNTLWFERKHGWHGLLVEANPDLCRQIDSHMRNVWRLCGCISNTEKSVDFVKDDIFGARTDAEKPERLLNSPEVIKVPCYSMRSVLNKIDVHHVHYFSLDVEGSELQVLESLKDDLVSGRLTVDVWTIEFLVKSGSYIDFTKSADKLEQIKRFFAEVGGYFPHSSLKLPVGDVVDIVFVNLKTWCNVEENRSSLHCKTDP